MTDFTERVVIKKGTNEVIRLGLGAAISAGGNGATNGQIFLAPKTAINFFKADDTIDYIIATIRIDSEYGHIAAGGNNTAGALVLFPKTASSTHEWRDATIRLDSETGQISAGRNGKAGQLVLFPSNATDSFNWHQSTIRLEGDYGHLCIGSNNKSGQLLLFPSNATDNYDWTKATIHLDAERGDITLRGADCAEYFAVAEPKNISPGTVLIAESEDVLIPSQNPYDKRVVGVVSGGGDYKPGILLGKDLKEHGLPIALNGKVYCNVDTSNGAIGVGDLLTTSSTSGHAMKADDPMKSFGAIIGKALKPLSEGKGLIPILVALQ